MKNIKSIKTVLPIISIINSNFDLTKLKKGTRIYKKYEYDEYKYKYKILNERANYYNSYLLDSISYRIITKGKHKGKKETTLNLIYEPHYLELNNYTKEKLKIIGNNVSALWGLETNVLIVDENIYQIDNFANKVKGYLSNFNIKELKIKSNET